MSSYAEADRCAWRNTAVYFSVVLFMIPNIAIRFHTAAVPDCTIEVGVYGESTLFFTSNLWIWLLTDAVYGFTYIIRHSLSIGE